MMAAAPGANRLGLVACTVLAAVAGCDGGARAPYAVVSTVVSRACDPAKERICRAHHTPRKIAALAYKMGCQLRAHAYTGPKVLLMHGEYDEDSMAMLHAQGWDLRNLTRDLRPLFRTLPGQPTPLLQLPPRKPKIVQPRNDGWATLYKLFAWTLVEYDMVLHTDLDVVLSASPEPTLQRARSAGLLFQAAPERAYRGYWGLNTHSARGARALARHSRSALEGCGLRPAPPSLAAPPRPSAPHRARAARPPRPVMLLRPSHETFALLMANALRGHFLPFTRTEQDVLETVFPPELFLQPDWGPGAAGGNGSAAAKSGSAKAQQHQPIRWPRHKHWGPDAEHALCARYAHCCPAPTERMAAAGAGGLLAGSKPLAAGTSSRRRAAVAG